MNHEKLSMRLERVATYIPEGSVLADIGSDHAYLPCYAVQKGLTVRAIAGEVVEGPFQSAKKQVKQTELDDQIDVRLGNGLDVLQPNEATCITIAGMGGILISSILENGKDKLGAVKRLVLQPNVGSNIIRTWLLENNWELVNEEILEEDEKIYEILIAERGIPAKPYLNHGETALLFGPFLMEQRHEVFLKKWQLEKEHWQRIIKEMDEKSQNATTNSKRQELMNQIQKLEEVLGI